MADKFIKTRSNYTLKKEHQKINNGSVFERDFMTISGAQGFSPTERPLYGDSNFLFVTRSGINAQKKHKQGNWLVRPECASEPNQTIWTTNCLGERLSNNNKIELNPNYTSIKDFAYYGSAVDLVRSSITEIIFKFPAELYFTDITYIFKDEKYYIVENDFGIDVSSQSIKGVETNNVLRYMCESYQNYEKIAPNGTVSQNTWSFVSATTQCFDYEGGEDKIAEIEIGGITVIVIAKNGQRILLYNDIDSIGTRIRPKQTFVDAFYENLNDFERLLVNRNTTPIYKADFITPFENESGYFSNMRSYIWPNKHDWNLDITTPNYSIYIDSLVELASLHDELDSDNIWRSMTHEAIKNLDWTFIREKTGEVTEMETIDTSKIEPILKLYGRQYDDLKRYIDNIRYINNITYDKKSNIPDIFLANSLNLSGWDVKSLNTSFMEEETSIQYPAINVVYTPVASNNEFYRRLKLNSKYLLNMKGTRKGVEAILALMGFKRYQYEDITYDLKNKYVGVYFTSATTRELKENYNTDSEYPIPNELNGKTTPEYWYNTDLKRWYRLVGDYTMSENVVIAKKAEKPRGGGISYPDAKTVMEYNNELIQFEGLSLYGLPLAYIPIDENGEGYVIPWFSKGEYHNNGLYFQKYGGWGKTDSKLVHNLDNPKTDEDVWMKRDEKRGTDFLYSETSTDMKIVQSINDMLHLGNKAVKTETICYVTDLTGLIDEDYGSHYFALYNGDNWGKLSTDVSDDAGWIHIPTNMLNAEIDIIDDTPTSKFWWRMGKKVLYQESIIDTNEGNNPHIGNSYDDGKQYIRSMTHPFEDLFNSQSIPYVDDEKKGEIISSASWETEYVVDNKKTWYFGSDLKEGFQKDAEGKDVPEPPYEIGVKTFNPEDVTKTADEAAANSVINVKTLKIEFLAKVNSIPKDKIRQYISDRVMFYTMQMIPSSTILEFTINFVEGSVSNMEDTSMFEDRVPVDGVIYAAYGEKDLVDGLDLSENTRRISVEK